MTATAMATKLIFCVSPSVRVVGTRDASARYAPRMGFFGRISRVIRGKANATLDKLTDPVKEVEHLVNEMEEQVRIARAETVKVKATEKLCAQHVADLEKQVAAWGERAETAVRAGDDDLAKKALEQRATLEQELATGRRELADSTMYAGKLRDNLGELERKIKKYKMKKGTIQAKAQMGKKTLEPGATDAFEEFERMAGKVDESEFEADAQIEMASSDAKEEDLAQRIDRAAGAAGKGSPMDDRLAALKAQMTATAAAKALPAPAADKKSDKKPE